VSSRFHAPSYPGFDAFNRVTDLPWSKTTSGDIAHLKYGYDLAATARIAKT
jgi:hypothetical protein